MTVAVGRAPHLGDDVLVAVVVEIGKGDAVSLVQLTRSRRGSDIHEILSVVIAQKDVGNERAVGGIPGS